MRYGRLLVLCLISITAGVGCDGEPRPAETVFAQWRGIKNQDLRQPLAEEMIRDGQLIGLTQEQVVTALGKPNPRIMSASYGDLKYVVGPSGIDDLWLCIHLTDGKVARTELRSD